MLREPEQPAALIDERRHDPREHGHVREQEQPASAARRSRDAPPRACSCTASRARRRSSATARPAACTAACRRRASRCAARRAAAATVLVGVAADRVDDAERRHEHLARRERADRGRRRSSSRSRAARSRARSRDRAGRRSCSRGARPARARPRARRCASSLGACCDQRGVVGRARRQLAREVEQGPQRDRAARGSRCPPRAGTSTTCPTSCGARRARAASGTAAAR